MSGKADCPAATHGRELVRTIEALRRFEEVERRREEASWAARARQFEDRIQVLEGALAQCRAASAEGGLYQVLLTAGALDGLERELEESLTPEAAALVRRQQACIYSLLELLGAQAGIDPYALVPGWYLVPSLNPHGAFEQGRQEEAA